MTGTRTAGMLAGLAIYVSLAILGLLADARVPLAAAADPAKPSDAARNKETEPKVRVSAPQDVTLTGRLVDFHSFMTGSYPNADRAKTTAELIRAGVPAGLDTPAGLILLGMGTKNPADRLVPLAYEDVEVKGKLYLRRGARYIEFTSIKKAGEVDTLGTPARPLTVKATPGTKPASP